MYESRSPPVNSNRLSYFNPSRCVTDKAVSVALPGSNTESITDNPSSQALLVLLWVGVSMSSTVYVSDCSM